MDEGNRGSVAGRWVNLVLPLDKEMFSSQRGRTWRCQTMEDVSVCGGGVYRVHFVFMGPRPPFECIARQRNALLQP